MQATEGVLTNPWFPIVLEVAGVLLGLALAESRRPASVPGSPATGVPTDEYQTEETRRALAQELRELRRERERVSRERRRSRRREPSAPDDDTASVFIIMSVALTLVALALSVAIAWFLQYRDLILNMFLGTLLFLIALCLGLAIRLPKLAPRADRGINNAVLLCAVWLVVAPLTLFAVRHPLATSERFSNILDLTSSADVWQVRRALLDTYGAEGFIYIGAQFLGLVLLLLTTVIVVLVCVRTVAFAVWQHKYRIDVDSGGWLRHLAGRRQPHAYVWLSVASCLGLLSVLLSSGLAYAWLKDTSLVEVDLTSSGNQARVPVAITSTSGRDPQLQVLFRRCLKDQVYRVELHSVAKPMAPRTPASPTRATARGTKPSVAAATPSRSSVAVVPAADAPKVLWTIASESGMVFERLTLGTRPPAWREVEPLLRRWSQNEPLQLRLLSTHHGWMHLTFTPAQVRADRILTTRGVIGAKAWSAVDACRG